MYKTLTRLGLLIVIILFSLSFPKIATAQSILFQDDFEQDRSAQWNIVGGAWLRKFVDASTRYGLQLDCGGCVTQTDGGNFNWTDYEFSFDMLPISDINNPGYDRNILFRVTNQKSNAVDYYDFPVAYGLHLYPNYIWLQKWTATEYTEPASTPITLPDNVATHFRIRLNKSRIQVFLKNNATPIIDYVDPQPILSGKISLMITTGASYPTEVWLDNVEHFANRRLAV
ncbi:MAG: hypothetical protein UU12_C0013G0001, partial [Candidatus Woesebacteria bacterium GW2011_GWA2_40_7b]